MEKPALAPVAHAASGTLHVPVTVTYGPSRNPQTRQVMAFLNSAAARPLVLAHGYAVLPAP